MAGSVTTTRISLLEIGTDQDYDDEGTLFIPSSSTIEGSGAVVATGHLDASSASFSAPAVEGAIASAAGLAAGQFSVVSLSGLTAQLAYIDASNITIYTWGSANGDSV